jgi:transposase-like protein
MARSERDPKREQFWRNALARFGGSGLSVREFCRRERLGEPLFYAWRRTIAERDRAAPPRGGRVALRKPSRPPRSRRAGAGSPAAFLPVLMSHEPAPLTANIRIELRGGRMLRFDDSLSAQRLAEFVRALEATEAAS